MTTSRDDLIELTTSEVEDLAERDWQVRVREKTALQLLQALAEKPRIPADWFDEVQKTSTGPLFAKPTEIKFRADPWPPAYPPPPPPRPRTYCGSDVEYVGKFSYPGLAPRGVDPQADYDTAVETLQELEARWNEAKQQEANAPPKAPRRFVAVLKAHADWDDLKLKELREAEPEYVGLFPPEPVQVAERKPWNTCKVCNAKFSKGFAYFYPCGHGIVIREWLSPIPVGPIAEPAAFMEDSWLVSSQGTAARHPTRDGAVAELRKKLGA